MSWLYPCPGCGINRKADEGHHLCRPCEGYRPRDAWLDDVDELVAETARQSAEFTDRDTLTNPEGNTE